MRATLMGLFASMAACAAWAQEPVPAYTVRSGDAPALTIQVPGKVTITVTTNETTLQTTNLFLHVWVVAKATNVTDGISRLAEVIQGEVLKFKPATTTDLTIAGAPAKRLFGPGTEADDGDEGHADVVVFTVGGRVCVACVHGEKLEPAERQLMLAALQTVRAP